VHETKGFLHRLLGMLWFRLAFDQKAHLLQRISKARTSASPTQAALDMWGITPDPRFQFRAYHHCGGPASPAGPFKTGPNLAFQRFA